MQKFDVKIGKDKKKVRVIRDEKTIDEVLHQYQYNFYLKEMLLQNEREKQLEEERKRKEQEALERKAARQERWNLKLWHQQMRERLKMG